MRLCTKYIVFGDFRILGHSFSEPSRALKSTSHNKTQKAQAYLAVETRPWFCTRTKSSNPTPRIGLAWAYGTNAGSGRFPGPPTTSGFRVLSACKKSTSSSNKKSLWNVQPAQLDEQVGTHTHTSSCMSNLHVHDRPQAGAGGGLKTLFLDRETKKDAESLVRPVVCVCACKLKPVPRHYLERKAENRIH